ncbi:MAG: hypothetical protein ACHQM6_03140 [Candidatus Kapaibacterium sp.]
MRTAFSGFNGNTIRLTDERWQHIIEEHPELQGKDRDVLHTIEKPEKIYEGKDGELLATREIEPKKLIVVVYREALPDGFIITAFFTRQIRSFDKRKQIW